MIRTPRKKHTLEWKQEAVRLVSQQSMTFAQVGQYLGENKSTIRDLCLRSQDDRFTGSGQGTKEMMEDELFRREEPNSPRRACNPKKAAVFFAKESR